MEEKGWESLGKDVHLIDTAKGPMRSHLQRNVQSSLERVVIFIMWMCVYTYIVCMYLCLPHQLREQEDCYMEIKNYIWVCPMSQSSSVWPSAALLSSPYLQRKRQKENTCHSYLKNCGLKELTGPRKWWKKVSKWIWGNVQCNNTKNYGHKV